ncbi:hypothetical protein OQX61_11125 [Pedobacter sp. PLR]|uniref:hypothetical protein n=1 Tax=Pedobacter sp. PLR TaxID=2994465 RepID=UPI0022458485|nr:hypothetical protein [Pedobacter sp. PLR]MCX2451813.1 hypothetical protein [Pedobacter sp. PLR]
MGAYGGWTFEVQETAMVINVKMKLKLAILDTTDDKKIDLTALGNAVERQLRKTYQISYVTNAMGRDNTARLKSSLDGYPGRTISLPVKKTVQIIFNMKYRTITKERHKMNNEHLLMISPNSGRMKKLYGYANKIGGNTINLNVMYVPDMVSGADSNTLPHEFGHTLTLLHVNDVHTVDTDPNQYFSLYQQYFSKDTTNIMFKGGSRKMNNITSTSIIGFQMDIILKSYKNGRLNLD